VQPLKADVSALLSIPRRTDPVHAKATIKQVNEFIATLPKRDDLSGKQQLCAYLYTLLPFVNGFHDTPRPFTINFLTSNANEEPSLSLKVGNWHTFIMEEHAKAFVPWCADTHGGAVSPACPDEIMLFFQANLPREEAMVCNSERSVLGAMNRNLLARSLSSETQHLELIADPDPRIRFYFAVHSAKRTLVKDWKWVTTARYGEFDSSRTSVVLATANNWLHKGGKEVTVLQHLFNSGWIRPPYWFRQEI
jgi:hypothetical protein